MARLRLDSTLAWCLVCAGLVACGSAAHGSGAAEPEGDTSATASEPKDPRSDGPQDSEEEPDDDAPKDAGPKPRKDAGATDGATIATGDAGDAGATADGSVDAATGDGGKADASSPANGTCTYREVPRILSCPTGMACRCYDSPHTLFKDSPAQIDLVLTGTTVQITGGTLPTNPMLTGVPAATIPLSASAPQTGSVHPYSVTVDESGTTVKLSMTTGYRPEKYIKYSSADCGYTGNSLDCTFRVP